MNFNFDTGTIDTLQTLDCTQLPALGGTAGVLTLVGTGALLLLQGTTAQRPAGVAGMFRFNQDTTLLEYFDGTTWDPLSSASAVVSSVNIGTSSGPAVVVGGGPITSTGTLTVDVSASLQALSTLGAAAGTGILVQTGVGTFSNTTIVGTAGDISVTNGSGVAGNPTIDLVNAGTPVTAQFVKITTDTKGRVTATTAVTPTDITTALGYTPINKAGDTNIGNLSMGSGNSITFNGGTVTGLPTPVSATDAANKQYVDSIAGGINAKGAVRAASTVNLSVTPAGSQATHTLTATANGQFVLDGITLATNDRVLVKNQTIISDNGVYIVTNTGSPGTPYVLTRSTDFNGVAPTGTVAAGDFVFVEDGSTFSNTGWVVYVPGDAPIVVDTDPINWTQFTGTGSVTLAFAGDTGSPDILVSGQTLHLVGTANQIATFADGTNNITFSLPQDIAPASSPTFTALTLSGLPVDAVLSTNGSSVIVGTALTNGQLLIGSTGAAPVAGTITAGTAVSVVNGAGTITINNTGVTSAVAGTGISVSSATGAVTIGNTGVLSLTNTDSNITFSVSTGAITANLASALAVTSLSLSGLTTNGILYAGVGGAITSTASPTNGQFLVGSTGAAPQLATLTAGTGVSITNGAHSITVTNTGVTSVALADGSTAPIYTVSGSPVTTTGTLTLTLSTQTAGTVFAGPVSGGAAQPTFRTLSYSDLPLKLYVENSSSPVAPSATGTNAVAIGSSAVASNYGSFVTSGGEFATAGDAQAGTYILRNITTDATTTELFLDGVTATQRLIFANNSVVTFDILITARRTDATGGGAGYRFVGVIRKDTTAGSNTFVGSVSKTVIGETLATWDANCLASTINGNLEVTVNGVAGSTIRWVAVVRTTEVTN